MSRMGATGNLPSIAIKTRLWGVFSGVGMSESYNPPVPFQVMRRFSSNQWGSDPFGKFLYST